ncbi:GNAT family N-acetyltransferase [Priestia aryabhattai]|uniref:GNAT family N-acetyltransferase n=1 Tax=Priestia aryabhattai TaxID=412384 RepID=UPI0007ABB861|nr:GNAT family N-acetyltransferase [Priestia aryabhattai]KZE15212.1 GCN5 family acetyltransferase [Priestia aryabhattai]MDE8672571.1 GNAT family N-acetyltransferase [Priestia aryabhattai]
MIREISSSDAAAFLTLNKKLDKETAYMLYEENERATTLEQQKKMITTFLKMPNSTILVAEQDGQLVGHLSMIGGSVNRKKHSAYLAVGVLHSYGNRGIGTALFEEMEKWAAQSGIKRVELTVMTHNEPAISLYKKMGFEIEGKKVCSLVVDGKSVDEYYMGKVFEKTCLKEK